MENIHFLDGRISPDLALGLVLKRLSSMTPEEVWEMVHREVPVKQRIPNEGGMRK